MQRAVELPTIWQTLPAPNQRMKRRREADGCARSSAGKGDDDRSVWTAPSNIRPGDTIVAPAHYGGLDGFGWKPESDQPVTDVAQAAARPFNGRYFGVRVAPGLSGPSMSDVTLAEVLAGAPSDHWRDLRDALVDLNLPEVIRHDLLALDKAQSRKIVAYTDLHGTSNGQPRGVVFVAPFGIEDGSPSDGGQASATEDDTAGSTPGFDLLLATHTEDVTAKAESFAKSTGLPAARVADLKLAGYLHDIGKADPRFQAWLHYGDPLGPDPQHVVAKSGRSLPRTARDRSELPKNWRHEACSGTAPRAQTRPSPKPMTRS